MINRVVFDISIWAIIKVIAVFFALKFFITIIDILLLFYIVLILVAALSPVVDDWSKKMNRVAAISLLYLVIVGAVSMVLLIVVPPVVGQIEELSHTLPTYLSQSFNSAGIGEQFNFSKENITSVAGKIPNITNQLFSVTSSVFGGFVALFTVMVLTFYLLLEEHGARKFLSQYLPLDEREKVIDIAQKIGNKMGAWMRGQLLLGLIIGIVSGVGLGVLGVPYAITLAVWAGFTELIPYVGPILGAIPAIFLAFTISPVIGVLTIALYVIVQQVEANFLVPKIMQKAVGLSPVIIILAMLVGGKLAGLMGIILAIPTAVIVSVLITELPMFKKAFNDRYPKKEIV